MTLWIIPTSSNPTTLWTCPLESSISPVKRTVPLKGAPLSQNVTTLWLIFRVSKCLGWGNFRSLFTFKKDGITESSLDLMLTWPWSSLFGDLVGVLNSELSSSNGASLSSPTKTPQSLGHVKYCLFRNVPSDVPEPWFCWKIEKSRKMCYGHIYISWCLPWELQGIN